MERTRRCRRQYGLALGEQPKHDETCGEISWSIAKIVDHEERTTTENHPVCNCCCGGRRCACKVVPVNTFKLKRLSRSFAIMQNEWSNLVRHSTASVPALPSFPSAHSMHGRIAHASLSRGLLKLSLRCHRALSLLQHILERPLHLGRSTHRRNVVLGSPRRNQERARRLIGLRFSRLPR